jgi:hypothetical protein
MFSSLKVVAQVASTNDSPAPFYWKAFDLSNGKLPTESALMEYVSTK